VQASFAVYNENKKVYESAPVRANRLNDKREGTLPVWMQIPVASLPPGQYDGQLNLIDQFGRKFAFPRTSLAVVAGSTTAP
jgi:hypothetical protein